jgi:uncharacterized membrane protein YphA (DoxX/SURF4 family)
VIADLIGIVAIAIRVLLGAIFLQAGVQKLRHLRAWQGVLGNYRMLPELIVPAVSISLPLIEIALAIALVSNVLPVPSALCASALLMAFTIAIATNIARGRSEIDCGCFQSTLRQTLSGKLLARNIALIVVALGGLDFSAAIAPDVTELTVQMIAMIFGAVCFVLYLTINELLT